jgi:hypothetical protein
MVFRKLERVWSYNQYSNIPNFTKTFPELNQVSYEELCDRWRSLGVDMYATKVTPVKAWTRFTLPFAVVLLTLMFIGMPFAFFITGKWGYGVGNGKVYNWFKALRLFR